eukprot:scaffold130488_cov17-Tisochrysis_lutea.AAC.2
MNTWTLLHQSRRRIGGGDGIRRYNMRHVCQPASLCCIIVRIPANWHVISTTLKGFTGLGRSHEDAHLQIIGTTRADFGDSLWLLF